MFASSLGEEAGLRTPFLKAVPILLRMGRTDLLASCPADRHTAPRSTHHRPAALMDLHQQIVPFPWKQHN